MRDETSVHSELESKGLLPAYNRVVEQLASLDQKAQAMVSMEALLLALIAVFSSSLPNNPSVKGAAWAALILILASALCSLLVLRIRYGTVIIAQSPTSEEGLLEFRRWRDHKLKLHQVALTMLAAGLFGLMVVVTTVLL